MILPMSDIVSKGIACETVSGNRSPFENDTFTYHDTTSCKGITMILIE